MSSRRTVSSRLSRKISSTCPISMSMPARTSPTTDRGAAALSGHGTKSAGSRFASSLATVIMSLRVNGHCQGFALRASDVASPAGALYLEREVRRAGLRAGAQPPSRSRAKTGEPIFSSWNQLDGGCGRIEDLRFVARPEPLIVAGKSSQDLPARSPYSQSYGTPVSPSTKRTRSAKRAAARTSLARISTQRRRRARQTKLLAVCASWPPL